MPADGLCAAGQMWGISAHPGLAALLSSYLCPAWVWKGACRLAALNASSNWISTARFDSMMRRLVRDSLRAQSPLEFSHSQESQRASSMIDRRHEAQTRTLIAGKLSSGGMADGRCREPSAATMH